MVFIVTLSYHVYSEVMIRWLFHMIWHFKSIEPIGTVNRSRSPFKVCIIEFMVAAQYVVGDIISLTCGGRIHLTK